MSLLQVFQILRAHYRVASVTPVVVVLIALVVTLQLPKQYSATTALVVDVKSDPLLGALLPNVGSPGYMATQTEIVKSERVAQKVVDLLGLNKSEMAVDRWTEDTGGRTPFASYWGTLLGKGLLVEVTRGSSIINISYTGQEPKFATAVTNAFAQAYIDVTIDLRVEPARQYAAWFDQRVHELRGNVEKAQARLSEFQQAKGIVVTDDRLDQETARLNALIAELTSAQAATAVSVSRLKSNQDAMSPDVQLDPVVQSLKSELARAETKLAEISLNVGENHPQHAQLTTQIAGLRQQLETEIARVGGVTAAATRVSSQRESELRTLIEAQKTRVLSLRAQRDEMALLARDVDSATRTLETMTQRMSQTSLESQFDQTNVKVLSPAVEPLEPSGPKLMRNLLGAVIGGIVLGAALAIGLEFLDRRVRTPADLDTEHKIPLLGELGPRSHKPSWKERVDAFGDWLRGRRHAAGTT
jgi:chain length determinant protein EpsF